MQQMPPVGHLLYSRSQTFRMYLLELPWTKFMEQPAGYFLMVPNFEMLHKEQMVVWNAVYDERTLLRPAQGVHEGRTELLRAAGGVSASVAELLRAAE